jgi:hypothetical protein
MSGTNQENNGLSDNEKLNEPSMEDIADAIQSGDMSNLDRLMGVEKDESEETEPNQPDSANTEDDTPEGEESEEAEAEHVEEDENGEGKSEKEEASTPEAAGTAASSAPTAQEIEELRRELHRYKSDAGRVPHMQRRMAELERELRANKARNPDNPNGVKPTPDVSSIELDEETKNQIEELRSVDPVAAKTMERVAKAAIAAAAARSTTAFETYVSEEQKADDERFYIEQKSILGQMIPQADQIFATPEWQAWKQSLSPGRRAMAESAYADEVAQAIYAFAADMQRYQAQQQGTPTHQAAPTPNTPVPNVEESEVHKARQKKVARAAGVPNTAAKKDAPLDEQAYFEQMYGDIAKANHIIK